MRGDSPATQDELARIGEAFDTCGSPAEVGRTLGLTPLKPAA